MGYINPRIVINSLTYATNYFEVVSKTHKAMNYILLPINMDDALYLVDFLRHILLHRTLLNAPLTERSAAIEFCLNTIIPSYLPPILEERHTSTQSVFEVRSLADSFFSDDINEAEERERVDVFNNYPF